MEKKILLNKTLFWDVNPQALDYKKDANFIVERVLNFGDEKDYQTIKKIYGIKKIKEISKGVNYNNKKNINFWGNIFNISPKLFKCTRKFSKKEQNTFLMR